MTKKNKFHQRKNLILSEDENTKKVKVPNSVSSDEKIYNYFIGYKDDDHKFKPLLTIFPKMNVYVKSYAGQTKWIYYFFIEDHKLLEKYNSIWNNSSSSKKVSNSSKKEHDCEPIYNEKFLKTKIRSYTHEATDFHDNEIPKVNSNYTCLAVALFDFVLKKDQNYYPQVFLKECKHIEKGKKFIQYTTDDLGHFSDSDESDEE